MPHSSILLDSQYKLIMGLVLCSGGPDDPISIGKTAKELGISEYKIKKWLRLAEIKSQSTDQPFKIHKRNDLYTIEKTKFTPPPIELIQSLSQKEEVKKTRFTPLMKKKTTKRIGVSKKATFGGYGNTKRDFLKTRFTPPPIELIQSLSQKELAKFLRFTHQFVKNKNTAMYLYIYILNTCININIAIAIFILIHSRPSKKLFLPSGIVSNPPTLVPAPPPPQFFGNEKINLMLDALRAKLGLKYFADTHRNSRIYGKHLVYLYEKHGKEAFNKALKTLLSDGWKKEKCSSIRFLYYQLKPLIGKQEEGSTIESIADKFNKF
jgi:hypothetical protein